MYARDQDPSLPRSETIGTNPWHLLCRVASVRAGRTTLLGKDIFDLF